MRAKWIVSSILATLLLAFTFVPAFADVVSQINWSSRVEGTSLADTGARNIDYVRVGTDSVTQEYVFQMVLQAFPTGSNPYDHETIYGIYLGPTPLDVPAIGEMMPTAPATVERLFVVWRQGGFFNEFEPDTSIPAAFTTSAADRSLEWRIDPNELWSTNFYFGAISLLDSGIIADVTQTAAVTPIPAAAWLLGSGIIGLIGIMRRNQKHSPENVA